MKDILKRIKKMNEDELLKLMYEYRFKLDRPVHEAIINRMIALNNSKRKQAIREN